jgi:hypothetical protein
MAIQAPTDHCPMSSQTGTKLLAIEIHLFWGSSCNPRFKLRALARLFSC